MPARIDIAPGTRFGRWRVLRRDRSRSGGGAYYVCRCACGREQSVMGQYLRTGRSTRCRACAGIGNRNRPRAYRPGDKIGLWTVIRYRPADRTYACRCACGTTGLVQTGDLRNGTSTRCGSCRETRRHRLTHPPRPAGLTPTGDDDGDAEDGRDVRGPARR